jgi:hypothetical protein
MTHILQGQVAALFAFDIGYEVSLEKLSSMVSTTPIRPLSRKKQTPTYLQYTRTPLILHIGLVTGHFAIPGNIQATIFDFGAVSISYRWPLAQNDPISIEEMPQMSHDLYALNLETHAREQVETLIKRIEPAIVRPNLSRMSEDYYLFIIEKLDQAHKGEQFVAQNRAALAQTLLFETSPLSKTQQDDALSQMISYFDNDLTMVDWNAAIIYDCDYEDTANVLELLNVELLEARYIDAKLDQRISEFHSQAQKHKQFPIPLRTPYKLAVGELAELRLESSLLYERVENSLKLVGDLYLARLHRAAAQKFQLHEWDRVISRKLEIISDYYEMLTDRVHTMQSQTLEIVIVLMILVELVMAFVGH